MTPTEDWDIDELDRVAALAHLARSRAGADALLRAARAPGRVNLIGEHTDYSGLPVLPMAIDRSTIVVAASRASAEIELLNTNPTYSSRRFPVERSIPPFASGDWGNYVKAAVQGVIDHFGARGIDVARLRGAAMVVDGRVPPAAGLSSSAALTVAAALAFMAVNGLELPALETAAMVAKSEWYVGTMAGGMDQAASLLGRRNHALFIEFNPLRVEPVKVPADAALVAANSCETADKSGLVRNEYNRRVIECAIAAKILARALGIGRARMLGDVARRLATWEAEKLIAALASAAPARLGGLDEAARILHQDSQSLAAELFGQGRVALEPGRPLELLRRARHVLSESRRVAQAKAALEAGRLDEVGELMNASHQSLKEDFEVSTPRLDKLVECARRGGALGARLTGAGFGGSIVALCRASDAATVIAQLDRGYYDAIGVAEPARQELRAALHAAEGAGVIELAAA